MVDNFKQVLQQNIIRNFPVTIDDMNISEKIYCDNIDDLKGKTNRNRPTHVKNDLLEVP